MKARPRAHALYRASADFELAKSPVSDGNLRREVPKPQWLEGGMGRLGRGIPGKVRPEPGLNITKACDGVVRQFEGLSG